MGQFSIVERGKEPRTVASISGAAMEWVENPGLRVYEMTPTGPIGPNYWQNGRQVTEDELRAALPVRV